LLQIVLEGLDFGSDFRTSRFFFGFPIPMRHASRSVANIYALDSRRFDFNVFVRQRLSKLRFFVIFPSPPCQWQDSARSYASINFYKSLSL